MTDSINNNTNTSSGCPVKHSNTDASTTTKSGTNNASGWGSFFQRAPNSSTTTADSNTDATTGGCPVRTIGDATPPSIEYANQHAQTPQPDQQIPLNTYRTISSIPKATTTTTTDTTTTSTSPTHQPTESTKWVYPSEQQFFNAMKRKGWEIPPGMESAIPHVVQIHNAVNEKGWTQVLQWENMRNNPHPRLVKFIGRPKDLSPKARFYSTLWGRNEPFDRHDWFVDRGDGSGERRYVIDFYNGKEGSDDGLRSENASGSGNGNGLPTMYLDVRPALDDLDSVQDIVKMFFKDAFPGISGLMNTSGSRSGNGIGSGNVSGSKSQNANVDGTR